MKICTALAITASVCLTHVTHAHASSLRGQNFLREEQQIEDAFGYSNNERHLTLEIIGTTGAISCSSSTSTDHGRITELIENNFNAWVSQCELALNLPDYGNTYTVKEVGTGTRRRVSDTTNFGYTYECIGCYTDDPCIQHGCRKLKKETLRTLISQEHENFENCITSKLRSSCGQFDCTSDLSSLNIEIDVYA